MTPNIITATPATPALSPALMPGGDPAGFARLLDGFAAQNLPAAAGSILPGMRQAVADPAGDDAAMPVDGAIPELPALDAVLTTGEAVPVGSGPDAPDGAASLLAGALPPGLAKRIGEIASPGKGKAGLHARPLPMPLRADAPESEDGLSAEPDEDAVIAPADTPARRQDPRPEPGFGAQAELAPREPLARPLEIAARAAEAPAIDAAGDAAPETPPQDAVAPTIAAAPTTTATAPDAAPTPAPVDPAAETPPPVAEAAVPVEARPEMPDRAEDRARGRDPERLTGLARAFERSGQPRLDPAQAAPAAPVPTPRPDTVAPAGRPFEALAALAAGAAPLRLLPAAPGDRTPAEPAAFDLAPVSASAPSFGFHPAASVHVRAPAFAAAAAPVVDTARADWLQSMIERIGEIRHENGTREAQIRLAPDMLGIVDVRIERRDERMHVTLSAENPQARALLSEAAPRLQEMAEARGLRLGQASVDAGASQQNPQRRPGGEAAPAPAAPPSARRGDDESPRSDDRIA